MACSCKPGACSCSRYTSASAAGRAAGRLSSLFDRARDMKARAGMRPHAVCIIRARSTGGTRRGDGTIEVLNEWPILPAPKVGDASSLKQILAPDQIRETGLIIVSEISASYTEDMLMGRGSDGKPIPSDEFVWWEIAWMNAHGEPSTRRRFVIDGAPAFVPESSQWTVTLQRDPRDRERSGIPR